MVYCEAGCYLTPGKTSHIEAVIADISQRPCRSDMLVAGDFNSNLAAPEENA